MYSILGSFIGAVGIFLPGALLIFFVYPLWEYLKRFTVVQRSLEGINAAAAGLVVAAAIILFVALDFQWRALALSDFIDMSIVAATVVILYFTKVPAPVLVVIALLIGFIL